MSKIKLFLVVLFLSFAVLVFAAPVTKNLTFEWDQNQEDLANLSEWRFYYTETSGSNYQPWLDDQGVQIKVVYDPANTGPTFTSPEYTINLDIPPGESRTFYYVLVAVDKEGNESAYSEEALNPDGTTGVEFRAPVSPPGTFKVTVQVITQ